ncbi:hypothetical protein VTK56DRAFT_2607 [Thermocarpiscus australiensis]
MATSALSQFVEGPDSRTKEVPGFVQTVANRMLEWRGICRSTPLSYQSPALIGHPYLLRCSARKQLDDFRGTSSLLSPPVHHVSVVCLRGESTDWPSWRALALVL